MAAGKKLKVGIDIDETITAEPEFFACLSQAFMAAGHEVHVLTFRGPDWPDNTEAYLKGIGVKYTALHLGGNFVDLGLKAKWAHDLHLDIVIEDRLSVLQAMPENVRGMLVLPKKQTGD